MKTQWSVDTVNRKRHPHRWRREKAMELAQRTGVPWSSMHSHGKVKFNAFVEFNQTLVDDPAMAEAVLVALRELGATNGLCATTMLKLSNQTGIALRDLNPVLVKMVRENEIQFGVDRMGKVVSFWRDIGGQ